MYKVSLPLFIKVSKNTKFYLNLNKYRNAHFHTLNTAKRVFKDIAEKELKKTNLPRMIREISIEYIYYNGTKAKSDIANVCSVVDKFFSDALVELGYLEDDNYEHLKNIKFTYGGLCRENPRVDIIITIGSEQHIISEPTKINNNKEIFMKFNVDKETVDEVLSSFLQTAMQEYVSSLVTLKDNTEVIAELKADGTVDVSIVPIKTKTVKQNKKKEEKVEEEVIKEEPKKQDKKEEEELPFEPDPQETEVKKEEPSLFSGLGEGKDATGKAASIFGEPEKQKSDQPEGSIFANILNK